MRCGQASLWHLATSPLSRRDITVQQYSVLSMICNINIILPLNISLSDHTQYLSSSSVLTELTDSSPGHEMR